MMGKIVFRSIIIAMLIALGSTLFSYAQSYLFDKELIEYCADQGKNDPECLDLQTIQTDIDAAAELQAAIYLFEFLVVFMLVFVGCIIFGVWLRYKPIS